MCDTIFIRFLKENENEIEKMGFGMNIQQHSRIVG